jgi:anti-sigma28 factor (negative regulator of flagellin synthesis)
MRDGSKSLSTGSNGAAAAVARQSEPDHPGNSLEDRITELRRRYLDGSYRVDAAKLSAKILDKHLAR